MKLEDKDGKPVDYLLTYPLYVRAQVAQVTNQKPISYYINVTAYDIENEHNQYTTVDNMGNNKVINEGDVIFSKHSDISSDVLEEQLDASNIDLENNTEYKVTCTVVMSSGLKATSSSNFRVAWVEEAPVPFAEISINEEDLSASIIPYVDSENADDVELSVYRKEYNNAR